jgi:hypothetical protein
MNRWLFDHWCVGVGAELRLLVFFDVEAFLLGIFKESLTRPIVSVDRISVIDVLSADTRKPPSRTMQTGQGLPAVHHNLA